jgi:hypothetical protein
MISSRRKAYGKIFVEPYYRQSLYFDAVLKEINARSKGKASD